jgi:3-oxoacyl-[acyl-carrier-protein] synthase-3
MLSIHGIGHFHPDNVIDNAFLESLDIGTNDEWIMERVGIRERRTTLSLDYVRTTHNRDPRAALEASVYTNAQMAARAAKMALDHAGIKAEDVGLVLAGGSSAPWSLPAEACICAAELGIETQAVDMNSGCSSFSTILHFVGSLRPEATPDYVLVLNPEGNTRVMSYDDRSSCVLFGDGATAAVVSNRIPSRAEVDHSTLQSSPKGWAQVTVRAGGFFQQTGRAVQTFAIRKTVSTFNGLREHARDPEKMYFIGHQANRLMLEAVCRMAPVAEERHFHNVAEFGNCSSAGAPSILSQNWDRFRPGDEIGMAVVGAGLTWSGLVIRFV